MDLVDNLIQPLVVSVLFTVIGLVLFGAALWVMGRVTPFSIQREIEEDQNMALGIIIAAVIIGIAIILAATLIDIGGTPAAG